jgi:hypothetical protein
VSSAEKNVAQSDVSGIGLRPATAEGEPCQRMFPVCPRE